jgi:hypothetical protein
MEEELQERIVPHLEKAVVGQNDFVFCTTEFNLSKELKFKADSETDALIQLGRKILAMREKLGESTDGIIAERICWYCRKWAGGNAGDGKKTQKLAQEFLQEISQG